jgi:hypothetical protein
VPSSKFVRRNRLAVAATMIAVSALVAATVFSSISSVQASQSARDERAMRRTAQETMFYLTKFPLAANTEEGLGRDTRVIDMLDSARGDAREIEDPLVSLSIRFLLASTFLSLDETQPAEDEIRLGIARAEQGGVDPGELAVA